MGEVLFRATRFRLAVLAFLVSTALPVKLLIGDFSKRFLCVNKRLHATRIERLSRESNPEKNFSGRFGPGEFHRAGRHKKAEMASHISLLHRVASRSFLMEVKDKFLSFVSRTSDEPITVELFPR